jgi:Protein of unknown function (DUF4435)
MIRYSPRSARAIGLLKSFYNDIEIFVEDSTSPNMHLLICRRVLGEGIRLSSVTSLGGRQAVLEACRLDQAASTRKRIYVIDGDLDLLLHRAKPRLRYLYRLRAYCVENLLVSQSAVESVCLQSAPQMQPPQVLAKLDFGTWLASLAKGLVPLFVTYGIARHVDPTLKTVSNSVHALCVQQSGGPRLSLTKVFAHIRSVFRQMRRTGNRLNAKATRPKLEACCSGGPSDLRYVSGKGHILPLLYHRLRSEFGFRGTIEQLKVHLASHYDRSTEPFYARALQRAAGR